MPALEPQTRFLLRGSALLVGLLTLWWFALLGPMLYLLKGSAGSFVHIQENASGDWTLRVPLERILPATPQQPVAQQIHSIDFDMPRGDAIAFTFSIPVFWAIVLAAPGVRRSLRPLLLGTALMFAFELITLLIFTRITARSVVAQLAGSEDATGKWIRHVGEYLIVSVLPYVIPFVVALSLHRELRREIFLWSKAADIPPASIPGGRPERRRAKKQRPD
ncbi:MAG: hypothetical protein NTW28_11895 [Candidatus Solibacter sp.]|nr:hypothetical protein [Candidatus Solibacter sp.]